MNEIPIDYYLGQFEKHLGNNERTIFSAKFGDGKTYFLNEFKQMYKGDYYFITLFPVNYSVSDNKDVFEYIKRDILLQLANDGKLNPIDLEAAIGSLFSLENLKELVDFLLSFMPHGAFYKKMIEKAAKLANTYNEKKSSLGKYEEFFEQQKGGIYESDGYTRIIEQTVLYIKNHEDKKTVLIIEDLDRVDPAHLFRILNVLGAHIDCYPFQKSEKKNKFGFDNIVTVFDYAVTEHMFHHFYGEKANYAGYINKFKVHQPFHYSINMAANEHLVRYIENMCGVQINLLKGDHAHSVSSKIAGLSIRDVCQILDNIDAQIDIKEIPANTNNLFFSSKAPITIFMVILIRVGMGRDEIKDYIVESFTGRDLLNFLSSFLSVDSWICTQNIINYRNVNFQIYKELSNKMITKISFEETMEHYGSSSRYQSIDTLIDRTLNTALNCIHY